MGEADDIALAEEADDIAAEEKEPTRITNDASNDSFEFAAPLTILESMGFDHASATAAITTTAGDTEAAITLLLSIDTLPEQTGASHPEWDAVTEELLDFGFPHTKEEIRNVVTE